VILVGTSGWQYPHWRGRFYPPGLPQARWLEYYTGQFATVEVNNTFYRLPERTTFARWRERTPDGFRVAAKMSRYLTHTRRLREPAEPVARFLDRAGALGDRLGPVLLQLPPDLPADPAALAAVLQRFPPEVRASPGIRRGGPTSYARPSRTTAPRCAGPTATSARSLHCGAPPASAICACTRARRICTPATGRPPYGAGWTGSPARSALHR
jgi:uncharacterized protein YecE (DUF72 family)